MLLIKVKFKNIFQYSSIWNNCFQYWLLSTIHYRFIPISLLGKLYARKINAVYLQFNLYLRPIFFSSKFLMNCALYFKFSNLITEQLIIIAHNNCAQNLLQNAPGSNGINPGSRTQAMSAPHCCCCADRANFNRWNLWRQSLWQILTPGFSIRQSNILRWLIW